MFTNDFTVAVNPATALAQMENSRLAGFIRAVGGLFEFLEERRKRAATIAELSRLSERELRDIGLSRCEIEMVAAGERIRDRA